jgi:hypothetical protein
MNSEDNGEDLFPQDALPVSSRWNKDVHRQPAPWHKPRKHWIRKEQWGTLAERLLAELSLHDRPFRYLTLPGKYLLDVRHLHEVCERRRIELRFLGFDSSRRDDPEITVSMDEVWRMPFIHKDSQLLADRVETLSNRRSIAFRNLTEFSDFDAINLDLCDSVASREAGASDSALEAIKTLVEIQSQRRRHPWLLFVTTRADRAAVKPSVVKRLFAVLQENLARNESFREKAGRAAFLDERAIASECDGQSTLLDEQFLRAFGVGFAKWLLKLSLRAWQVKLEVNACYRVADETQVPDMLSLAFRFESVPVPIADPTGLAPTRKAMHSAKAALSEDDQAVQFIDRFAKLIDLDQRLYDDKDLCEQMIAENADLMSQARFDRERIVDWGRTVCWKPRSP